MRRATTLVELLAVLAVVAIVLGIAIPRAAQFLDRINVRGAATEVATLFAVARHTALVRSTRTAVVMDSAAGVAAVVIASDTVAAVEVLSARGVHLRATRDSVAYGLTGLGYGASTTTVILARGQAAETLYVSRLGRVRR